MMPVTRISQAPWTLIVYRDLTHVRTLNLQAMTMVATLLLAILAAPFLAVVFGAPSAGPGLHLSGYGPIVSAWARTCI